MSTYIIHHHPRGEMEKYMNGEPTFAFCGRFAQLPEGETRTPDGTLCEDCREMHPKIMSYSA